MDRDLLEGLKRAVISNRLGSMERRPFKILFGPGSYYLDVGCSQIDRRMARSRFAHASVETAHGNGNHL